MGLLLIQLKWSELCQVLGEVLNRPSWLPVP